MVIEPTKKYTKFLPATAVSEDMRSEFVTLAKKHKTSIAEIQRVAFQFFLDNFDSKANKNDS